MNMISHKTLWHATQEKNNNKTSQKRRPGQMNPDEKIPPPTIDI